MDFSFKMRSMIFNDWMRGEGTVKNICKRYGLSRKCFYKFMDYAYDKPRHVHNAPFLT